MRVRSWFIALIMCVAATGVAFAQTGVISGTVKDSQGGALPGGPSPEGSGPSSMFVTEGDGAYRFLALPAASGHGPLTGFRADSRRRCPVGQNVALL